MREFNYKKDNYEVPGSPKVGDNIQLPDQTIVTVIAVGDGEDSTITVGPVKQAPGSGSSLVQAKLKND